MQLWNDETECLYAKRSKYAFARERIEYWGHYVDFEEYPHTQWKLKQLFNGIYSYIFLKDYMDLISYLSKNSAQKCLTNKKGTYIMSYKTVRSFKDFNNLKPIILDKLICNS